MKQQADAIIAGGGLTGLSAALALAQAGMRVRVADRAPLKETVLPAYDGRTTALSEGSVRLFRRLGVWEHIRPHAEAMTDIRVVDADSPLYVHYDHREVGAEAFGYVAENRYIRQALLKKVHATPRITVHAPADITALRQEAGRVALVLADGETLHASLLIGADGKGSAIRRMAGIGCFARPYRQTAMVCTLRHSLPHRGVAVERFLPSGPFAMLPMPDRHISIVWTERAERVADYLALDEDDFIAALRRRTGDWLGELELIGKRWAYPLGFMVADSLVAERIALVGDAAHVIHPIAGQGVNLGYRDVAALTDILAARFESGLDIGAADVMAAYDRSRNFDIQTLLGITDGINRLFSNASMPLALMRRLGLAAVHRLPPAKRLFMRHAMGVLGDVPALMQPVSV